MKKINLVLSIFLGLALAACDQDPMAKKADELRKAKPVTDLPQKPQPVDSDAIIIDYPQVFTFSEESRSEFKISAKVLMEGYSSIQYEIENKADFDQVIFNEQTGVFSWTPPKGTVTQEDKRLFDLKIRVYAEPKDPKGMVLTKARMAKILVNRNYWAPKIVNVKDFPDKIREGDYEYFRIQVSDVDSGPDVADAPFIQFTDLKKTEVNVSSTITLYKTEYNRGQRIWEYEYMLDLRNVELTSSLANFWLGIRVVNKYGKNSGTPIEMGGSVLTKLSRLETTWNSQLKLTAGENYKITFLVYDPKGEGMLRYLGQTFSGLPGSTLTCQGGGAVKTCDYVVKPEADLEGQQVLKFTFESLNRDPDDPKVKMEAFYLIYDVVPPVTPSKKGVVK